MEYVWRHRTRDAVKSLERRSRRLKREAESTAKPQDGAPPCPLTLAESIRLLRSSEWCSNRARAMAMTREDVITTCRERWRTTACKCGPREVLVGCDNPVLCSWCRQRHWRKWRRKITKSMAAHVRAARAQWNMYGRQGMCPGVYLITLTGPHSGDLLRDRLTLGKAVRGLLKYAAARGWWSHYALTWEVTAGTVGDGHVHAHLAVVSSWIPYTTDKGDRFGPRAPERAMFWVRRRYQRTPTMGLHEAWRHYMPGAVVLDVQSPNRYRKRGESPASYLAKYVTKGVDPAEMSGRKAGEMLVAFRGRRKLTTSRYFWLPQDTVCRTCGCYHRMLEAPCSLQDINPGAVLRSQVARRKWLGIQEWFPPWLSRPPDDKRN